MGGRWEIALIARCRRAAQQSTEAKRVLKCEQDRSPAACKTTDGLQQTLTLPPNQAIARPLPPTLAPAAKQHLGSTSAVRSATLQALWHTCTLHNAHSSSQNTVPPSDRLPPVIPGGNTYQSGDLCSRQLLVTAMASLGASRTGGLVIAAS